MLTYRPPRSRKVPGCRKAVSRYTDLRQVALRTLHRFAVAQGRAGVPPPVAARSFYAFSPPDCNSGAQEIALSTGLFTELARVRAALIPCKIVV